MSESSLSPVQTRFISTYLVGLDVDEAAREAGVEILSRGHSNGHEVYFMKHPQTGQSFFASKSAGTLVAGRVVCDLYVGEAGWRTRFIESRVGAADKAA